MYRTRGRSTCFTNKIYIMFKKSLLNSIASYFVIVAIVIGTSITHVELVHAAALTNLSDTLSSVKVNTLADHTIQFVTPSGISSGQGFSITFPVGWNLGQLGATSTDFATSTSASCSGFTDALLVNGAASGLSWGVATTSQSISITSGTAVVPANRCVQIRLGSNAISQASGTSQITNPSSATSSIITIGGTFGDTGSITVTIIGDDTVAMTGTVNQSLSFTISTSTIYFGTLGSGAAKYASSTNVAGDTTETIAHSLVVSTNAPSGFTVSVRGQTLTSQQNSSNTISAFGGTAASSTPGTEQFGFRATESGGTGVSISSPFNLSSSYGYNATATTSATLATGIGATAASTLSLRYVTNIAAITEAGTYAANLIYVATANF
jgi:hypothetical protein